MITEVGPFWQTDMLCFHNTNNDNLSVGTMRTKTLAVLVPRKQAELKSRMKSHTHWVQRSKINNSRLTKFTNKHYLSAAPNREEHSWRLLSWLQWATLAFNVFVTVTDAFTCPCDLTACAVADTDLHSKSTALSQATQAANTFRTLRIKVTFRAIIFGHASFLQDFIWLAPNALASNTRKVSGTAQDTGLGHMYQ